MANIRYSKAAIHDLEEIGDYISRQLKSPKAAENTVVKILDTIDKLADFPLIGAPLSSVFEIDTDYRFLVSGNYLAFYREHDDVVYVDRVLYGKRDYLALLFGELPQHDSPVY